MLRAPITIQLKPVPSQSSRGYSRAMIWNDTATQVADYINAKCAEAPTKTHTFVSALVAGDLRLDLDTVSSAINTLDFGHNGVTVLGEAAPGFED